MKRSPYGERDYAFGRLMLTLRTQMGLTQARLAKLLRVSRRAVSTWELGSNYPATAHLKELIVLGVELGAWAAGREEEEIRALWRAAHQKVLLDERWLQGLLGKERPRLVLVAPSSDEQTTADEQTVAQPVLGPRLDWGEALDVPSFYGREEELATLSQWIAQQRCRVVSVLGMGGIGKSALVTSAMRQVASHFQVVLFRSLRDAPSCQTLLESCLQVLSPERLTQVQEGLSARLDLLLSQLRRRRVLLVLDNLESLLQAGEVWGQLRPGYEDYSRLLQGVAETAHQSCLLLTSREKPTVVRALEGSQRPVRALRLSGLDVAAADQLLAEHELVGSQEEHERLVQAYSGNPLALNIVAQTITDLFGGQISPFLSAEAAIFGGIAQLLDEQWGRLSPLEQTVLSWLAILREPVTLDELRTVLVAPHAHVELLEAVDGLRRRSLIERGQRAGSFTLQSVVLEYVSERLVSTASKEIRQGRLALLLSHGLSQAQAKDYVRQTQERLLVAPSLPHLESLGYARAEVEGRLRSLLEEVRSWAQDRQGYGPANLVTLLRLLRGHLRGLDLSQLAIRGAYLQGIEMQDTSLSGALLQECVLTGAFDAIWAVAISGSGEYWATGSKQGEVRVWRENGHTLHLAWQAHTDIVPTLAFSPDERLLASGSLDGSIKLWDVERGAFLWSGWHTSLIVCLAFSPDGSLLASGGHYASIRLWDPKLGTPLEEVPHPAPVFALAWSPDGRLLASGDIEGGIRLWELQKTHPATCLARLSGHTNRVRELAFAPEGSLLASASWDRTVKLWEVGEMESLRLHQTLTGHTDRVNRVAWSPSGRILASCGFDKTIWLWEVEQGSYRAALQGHSDVVNGLAFTPDSRHLLSGSEDGTLRLWDVQRGEALRVLQGYTASLYDLDWSPDGTQLASAGADTVVSLWNVFGRGGGMPRGVLHGHSWTVYGLAWSPDGSRLASSGWDHAIRLWDPATGTCVQVLEDPDTPDTIFYGVAWSPDGDRLASGSFVQGVRVWDVTGRSQPWADRTDLTWVRRVTWSPDGRRLVGGGDDGHVYVWDASDGRRLLRLAGHHGAILSVVFSPQGSRLASASGSELFVWDAHSGERLSALQGLAGVIYTVAWHPVGDRLISGGSDGRLRWWEVQSGACVQVKEAHQGTVHALKVSPDGSRLASCGDDGAIMLWNLESGERLQTLRRDRPYERLDITGIRGLTEAQKASLRTLGAFEETRVSG